jgi:hypothetical protein
MATERHKLLKTVQKMKLYLICVSMNGLKDSDNDVRTLKMAHGVGSCQLLEIWELLEKFVNWWLEISKRP